MRRLLWLSGPMLCLSLLSGPVLADESPPPTAAAPAAEEEDPIDPQALTLLTHMAKTLAGADGFRVTIRSDFDVVQDTGEKISFGERRTVVLKRPSGLRIDVEESDGTHTQVSFDGKAITVFSPEDGVYGQIERPGTVDEAVHYVIQDLQIRLPLALLLVTSLPDELTQRLEALSYVERDMLTSVPTDHLVGQVEGADFQVWIPVQGDPLPQRVTITYKDDEGQPQFRAELTGWTLDPDVSSEQLAFTAPPGAERIPFVVRVRQGAGRQPSGAPNSSGDAEGASK